MGGSFSLMELSLLTDDRLFLFPREILKMFFLTFLMTCSISGGLSSITSSFFFISEIR